MGISLTLEFVSTIMPIGKPTEKTSSLPQWGKAKTDSKGMTEEWHPSIPQIPKKYKLWNSFSIKVGKLSLGNNQTGKVRKERQTREGKIGGGRGENKMQEKRSSLHEKTNTGWTRHEFWEFQDTFFLYLKCVFWTFQNIKPKHLISQGQSRLISDLVRSPPFILSPLGKIFFSFLSSFFFLHYKSDCYRRQRITKLYIMPLSWLYSRVAEKGTGRIFTLKRILFCVQKCR